MSTNNIILSVKRAIFRCDDPTSEYADSEFKKKRPKILERDDFTCVHCGFKSSKFQEIHHKDDDHSNNSDDNLITTCPLCHSCYHVGFTGQQGSGVIILLDEKLNVNQAELNQIVRTLWIGEAGDDKDIRMQSITMLAKLYKQSVPASRKYGTSDPVALGDFLVQMSDEDYVQRQKFLEGCYMLPLKDGYERQIQYWKSEVYSSIATTDWQSVSRDKLTRWATNEYGSSGDEQISKLINGNK